MITKPKGCYDINGKTAKIYQEIEKIVNDYARVYNYKYVRTPLFENAQLYKRGVGEGSDIVQKETYDFLDRGGRMLTLRPEGTAGTDGSAAAADRKRSFCCFGNRNQLSEDVYRIRGRRDGIVKAE